MNPIRVLLADDHELVRSGIRLVLEQLADVKVVAEAGNGREALQLIKATQPDVVLMDITMPELNGLEATAYITQNDPQARVILLSMHTDGQYIRQAMRAGATGYLLKDATKAELELAVKAAADGKTYLSPSVAKYIVTDYRRSLDMRIEKSPPSPGDELTPQERELLQLIAEGRTTKEIASRLHLSPKTVEARRARLMDHLDIHDVARLVRTAVRLGLVQPDG